MRGQWKGGWRVAMVLLATAALGAAGTNTMPGPGTVNYVEGEVAINGQDLTASSAGSTVLGLNQTLETGHGKVELLLTPGVFLRVGENSEVHMVSPGLADTSVELRRGTALVEAADLLKENRVTVLLGDSNTALHKNGLYAFDADRHVVSVLDGEVLVSEGASHVTLKKGREVVLASGQALKAQKFDKNALEAESLYRWSRVRGEYVAQANLDVANRVVAQGDWYGPGWYWDPYWSFYSYLPGTGMLWSPWGWGFYSPGWAWRAPLYAHGYWGGHAVRPAPVYSRPGGIARGSMGGFSRGGFHGGGMARGGGGMARGGGGMRGGGGGRR